jgi:DNA ligase-1
MLTKTKTGNPTELRPKSKSHASMRCYSPHGSPSAEAALSRKAEVDIKGGWRVGEPYASFGFGETASKAYILCSRVPYAAITKTFSLIEATTKRLEKTSLLTSFLVLVIQRSDKGDYKSLLQAVYLCINRVCH